MALNVNWANTAAVEWVSTGTATSTRQSIVDAIIARLQTILVTGGYETDLGYNVYAWRTVNVEESKLPCVIVKDTGEEVTTTGKNHIHDLQIELEAKTLGTDTRKVIADVMKAIGVDPNFDSQVILTEPVENETLDFEQNDKTFSSIIMKFVVKYATKAFEPY